MPTPQRDLPSSTPKIINYKKIMHVPGSIIGNRYQIIQKLGREEISKTYLAKDLQTTGDARCIVEQLNPTGDEQANWQVIKQHLINEVTVLKRLGEHSQIPQCYNYFIEDKQFYLVREYIDGDNLEQEVEHKLFDEADVVYLIQDVLRTLDFVHKTNVIHQDIQPVHLIKPKGKNTYFLIDFASLREIESTEIHLKGEFRNTKPLGNEPYIAPEQKVGESNFSSDIYALGRTAVFALTGRSPEEFEKTQINWQQECQLSHRLEAILSKMTASSIEERYASVLEVIYDLRPLLRIRQVIGGRYAVTQYLGGKVGIETYVADNLRRHYQSPCVIKQIELPDAHGADKVQIERRFTEELSVLERLGYHQQIPQLWDHFVENEEFYLVQEYIRGENLAQKIEQEDVSIVGVIGILESTLSVLDFIHQNRIIHRNIKPSNLIIRHEDQQVVLTDFGILTDIKALPNTTVDSDPSQEKYSYWSPEQIAGRPTVSSDLYALGMVVIEALTKIKPDTMPRNKKTGKLLWQKDIVLDRRLVKIIDKMIHPDLGQRYQSAERVLYDLQKINILADSRMRNPLKSNPQTTSRPRTPRGRLQILPIFIGVLGIACLLGSIEFAFPTVRPMYYWYKGKKLLPEKPQAALNTFTKGIDLKPESSLAWSGRGDALYSLKRYPEALESYYEATELDSTDFANWKKQGNTLSNLERFEEAIAAYDRALELEQNEGELYNRKGQALYQLERYQQALTMQEAALEIDRLDARFLSDRAKNLIPLGRYHEALTMVNRVQAIAPSSIRLWQDKPLILKALNRPQEAERVNQEILDEYPKIIEEQPQNARIWLAQGDFLTSIAMYQQAVDSYDRSIKLQPNFYKTWLAKGKALAKLGQDQEALAALDKALQIRPQSYKTWQAKGLVYLENQKNLPKAIAQFNQAIEINDNYALLWRDRGLALNQQGNYTQAIESLTKASKINPQDTNTWVGLATAWDITGQDRKALSALDRAIELKPQDPKLWSQKGQIYTKNAQYDEACDNYRQSRLIIPNSKVIIDAMINLGCRLN